MIDSDSKSRNLAMCCHLLSLIGYFSLLGFVVAPLVLWLAKRHEDPFVDDQGRESVNFQITVFLLLVVSMVLTLVAIGFILLPLIFLFHLVFTVIAAMRAHRGEAYRYPLVVRFLQ